MIYAGIDPGYDGAIAFIHDKLGFARLEIIDTPTRRPKNHREYVLEELVKPLQRYQPGEVCFALELVHAMPKNGAVSMFNFGHGYGIWQGALAMAGHDWRLVMPAVWRKAVIPAKPTIDSRRTGPAQAERKQLSVARAQELYPAHAREFVGPRGGIRDGRADAALLATWLAHQCGQDPIGSSASIARIQDPTRPACSSAQLG